MMRTLLAAGFLFARPCAAQEDVLEKTLAKVRAARADVAIRVDRWDTRMTLPAVEDLLKDPLKVPAAMEYWSKAMKDFKASAEAVRFAGGLLDVLPSTAPAAAGELAAVAGIPEEAHRALAGIVGALAAARPLLAKTVGSLSPEERNRVLAVVRPLLADEPAGRLDPKDFELMSRFELAPLIEAATLVARAVDAALPILREKAGATAVFGRERVKTPAGDLLIAGVSDDVYTAEDLKDVALLVDFGGKSRYEAAPAAAGEGELKVVIDLSPEVSVEAPEGGTASGTFGVGLLYLPEPGPKALRAGSYSLGAGLFGVGGLWLTGGGAQLAGERFSQGAAAFGAGILVADGKESRYALKVAGQGFGFTRGAGLFRHRGGGTVIDGGQTAPDPREPMAALSLSQGAGYGPRAFAAGGFGLASVAGERCDVRASYMAQGLGYWHAFGGFFLSGDENRVQSRRYSLGAGVHTAAGGFRLEGKRNRVITWGVGPGMGWDYGVGFLDARGDDNAFTSDWASGRGDVNGHGFISVRGDRNKLALADLGSGALKRGAPSYGVVSVQGEANRLLSPFADAGPLVMAADPWGALEADRGLRLDPKLAREPGDWVPVAREEAFARDRERLERKLDAARAKPSAERLADWLEAAASPGLDGETAFRAARQLITASDEELALLVALLSADAFDEFVWLRTLLPAFGRSLVPILRKELPAAVGQRRVLLLSLYRHLPVSESAPLYEALGAADWRARREAAASLGRLFNRERGSEPGRARLLELALELCRAKEPLAPDGKKEERWLAELGEQTLPDLFGVLGLGPGLAPVDRSLILAQNPDPFGPARKETLREFARLLSQGKAAYAAALAEELRQTAARQDKARAALLALLDDSDREVVSAALGALGGIGAKEDAGKLVAAFEDPSALIRDGAAASLGRMGASAQAELEYALKSPSPKVRALAALALARTGEPEVLASLKPALSDESEEVRRTALAALRAVQTPLRAERGQFRSRLRRLAQDPSAAIRVAALRALADIGD